jgi:anti-sigma-K factor RskA
MDHRDDSELQRYHDGELGRGAARRVRRRVATDVSQRDRLQAMEQMGQLVREVTDEAVGSADFSGLWGKVERGIVREPGVVQERGLWRRWLGWTAVAASAAAVATLAFVLLSPVQRVSNECQIESLEVGPEAVSTIFTIDDPDSDGATTVIWVSDTTS